jgi:catechol 2,3-dioxygenase-like lactoylglutathione lyase family enzyme
VSTQLSSESQPTFTGVVPVLPTTNISQAASFYGQLGFQVLHQEAEYAIVKRDGVELHVWLCPDRSLAENSSCRIQVTGIEALYREYQSKGLLASNVALRDTPRGTREFAVFDPDRVLITFVEHVP